MHLYRISACNYSFSETFGSTIFSHKTLPLEVTLPSPIQRLCRSSVCISCPNRSHKDRCVRLSLCLAIGRSPSVKFCRYPSALRPKIIRKSLSLLQRGRGSIFVGVPHRYFPCKDAFLDQDRARKLKPEWEPTDCTVRRRIILPGCMMEVNATHESTCPVVAVSGTFFILE